MNMKKQIVAAVMAAAVVLSAASCGTKTDYDVKLDKKEIVLPCTVDGIGEGYRLDASNTFQIGGSNNGASLMKGDDVYGRVVTDETRIEDIDGKSNIHSLVIFGGEEGTDVKFSVNGVELGATAEEVKKELGVPDVSSDASLKYRKGKTTVVFLLTEGVVTGISVADSGYERK